MMSWLPRNVVVVPLDFSDHAFAALSTAAEMVESPSNLYLVHVLPVLEPADPGVIWQTIDDQSRSDHAEKALRNELRKRGFEGLNVTIRFGDPGHEIADYARELDAGLVVVASHGLSGLRHLLLGSVAERAVRLCHCPVLVLKQRPAGGTSQT